MRKRTTFYNFWEPISDIFLKYQLRSVIKKKISSLSRKVNTNANSIKSSSVASLKVRYSFNKNIIKILVKRTASLLLSLGTNNKN
jgi:hypothetical protein